MYVRLRVHCVLFVFGAPAVLTPFPPGLEQKRRGLPLRT
uniref:Uncharacterized protein n=1 Tax=Anguilla anguilla TaxID=7936 RepID=A0A0E9TWX8_ANGAN